MFSFLNAHIFVTEAYLKYAHGIVAEYLPEDLSAKLYHHLKLPPDEAAGVKRKSLMPIDQKDAKKLKTEDENNSTDTGKVDTSEMPKQEKVCSSVTAQYNHQNFSVGIYN